MANILKHRFTSLKADGPDGTQVQPSHWNDGHAFTGGTAGDVLTRDPTDATFGAKWAPAGGAHATTHQAGGADVLALDTLGAPTDVTTLNATAAAHGLLPKLSGASAAYLNGLGGWTAPAPYLDSSFIDLKATTVWTNDAAAAISANQLVNRYKRLTRIDGTTDLIYWEVGINTWNLPGVSGGIWGRQLPFSLTLNTYFPVAKSSAGTAHFYYGSAAGVIVVSRNDGQTWPTGTGNLWFAVVATVGAH